ncbi:MAG: NADH-quinone oxidoreductase subunit M [Chloroflexi bacterium]|nr:NADH-quinone oxidoreductase subunit M [Chloroflexota bacterium]
MILSLLVFLPLLGALAIALLPVRDDRAIKITAALFTAASLVISGWVFVQAYFFMWLNPGDFQPLFVERVSWIPQLNSYYYLGVDGLSLPMVILTTVIGFLSVLVSWNITLRVREYFAWLLVLETGVLGVFTSLDLLLFFLFWEVELVPMYLLISIWGSAPPLGRREYSAMKFLIYTIFGSAFMLVGVLAVLFSAGTLDMRELATVPLREAILPVSVLFWLFFIAFAIKLPMFPFHTWLPDAHTDAPTAVSVMLAGVLLKMGGYGMLRICVSMFPEAAQTYAPLLAALAAIGIVYGALVALRQTDLKRMIAYSSVSHMGYVLLGIAALGEVGLTGAVLGMFTHGTITGLLFALVGLIYDRAHTREIPRLRGLAHQMPFIATVFVVAGLASLGLPSMSGFVAELLVFLGAFPRHAVWTVIGVTGVVLAAGYILWTVERILFRQPDPHFDELRDASVLEAVPLSVLVALIMVIGVRPTLLTNVIQHGIAPIILRLG